MSANVTTTVGFTRDTDMRVVVHDDVVALYLASGHVGIIFVEDPITEIDRLIASLGELREAVAANVAKKAAA